MLLIGVAAIAATGAGGAPRLRIGLVLDDTRVSDLFEHGAYVGLQKAARAFGVDAKVVAPAPRDPDATAAFAYLARQRYDLVIGLGFTQADSLDRVALRFPHVRFAILDASITDLKHEPKNVAGTHFRTEQGGYLAGYLAAVLGAAHGRHAVGSVGGVPIPPVEEFIAGYAAGARAADPNVRVLVHYSYDFLNPAKCRALAMEEIASGATAVFQVADECGLGALRAAAVKHVWGIGVDVDESYLGPQMLTSVVKRLDVAVYSLVRRFKAGRLRTGVDTEFDLADGGVALGKISPEVPLTVLHRLERIRAEIVAGKITVPGRL